MADKERHPSVLIGLVNAFARYNKEFDTTIFQTLAWMTHIGIIVAIFVFAFLMANELKPGGIITSELLHVMLMGSFGMLTAISGFLFGKKMGETNGNNNTNDSLDPNTQKKTGDHQ